MSIASETNRNNYVGNGAVDTYSYTFKIYDDGDLLVTVKSDLDVESTLTLNTHYSVTGVGESGGGSVALVNGAFDWIDAEGDLKSGYTISIRRNLALVQETDIRNQGEFFPEVHEDTFDRLTMYDQQQQDSIDRSVKLSETSDTGDFDPTLPVDIIGQVSKTIVTNATGDGFAVGPSADAINQAAADAAAAAASADLAEDWAIKTDDLVSTTDNSSKAWAIGGTGAGQPAAGPAKDWATKTSGDVDGSEYSAKEYATGTQTRGLANGGSSKDWANYTGGTVDDTEYSAKKYASDAAISAAAAAAANASSLWNDTTFKTFADSPITIVDADAGTLFAVDCTGGNVVINLPSIAALTLTNPWAVGFKKTDTSSNTITINRDGSDVIDGGTSKVITRAEAGVTLIPDVDSTPDEWTSLSYGELLITGEMVGTTDTQTLSNKTLVTPQIDDAAIFEQIATPSNPASGYNKIYPKSDGKFYNLKSDGSEEELGAGGEGGINYIDNNDFESNVLGWTVSKNTSAAATPDSGFVTSGLTNTFTRSTSSPLRGTASALFGLGALGNQVYYDFTIDEADKGKVLQGFLEYGISSGTFADDSVSVWIYYIDGVNSRFIQPAPSYLKNHSLSADKFPFEFQTQGGASATATYRLVLHQAAASTAVLKIDNVSVGPQAKLYGSSTIDWKPATGVKMYGATNGLEFTSQTTTALQAVRGDTLFLRIRTSFTGSPATGTGKFEWSLPSGLTADSTKINITSSATIGKISYLDSGTAFKENAFPYLQSTSRISVTSDGGTDRWDSTSPITWTTNDAIELVVEIPIVGFSSSQIMSHDANTRVIVSRAYKNGTQAVTSGDTKITSFTAYDPNGMWDSVNNRFNIKTPGEYDLTVQLNASVSSVRFMPAYSVNGGSKFYIGTFTDGGSDRTGGHALIADLKSGDYVELFISTNGSATIQAGSTNTFAALTKRDGPAQIMASESVSCRYYSTSGQSIPNAAGTTYIYGTKDWDTHGAFNSLTGIFTAPISGEYEANAKNLFTTGGGWSTGELADMSLVKNAASTASLDVRMSDATHSNYVQVKGTGKVMLLAGETAKIALFQNSGASLSVTTNALDNWLEINRVGNYA